MAAVVAVVAVGVGWLVWPGDERPEPRARVYTDASACLLTPAAGVGDKAAAPVWAGMQEASLATRGKVSYLEVNGAQTADNAVTYLGTLSVGGCDLILAAGAGPVAALDARASAYPKLRFVAVGGGKAQANVTVVREADAAATTAKVRDLVHDALASKD